MEQQDTKTTECCICYNRLQCKSYCFCQNQSIHRVCQMCYLQLKVMQCPVCRGQDNVSVKKNIYDIRLMRVEPICQLNRVFLYTDRINNISDFSFNETISFPDIDFKLLADCHIRLYCESKKLYAKYQVNQEYILRYLCKQLHKNIGFKYNINSFQYEINNDDKQQLKNMLQFTTILQSYNMNFKIRLMNSIGLPLYQREIIDNLFLNGLSSIPSMSDMKDVTKVAFTDCLMTNYIIQRSLGLEIYIIDTEDRDKYSIEERFQQRCKLFLQ